MRNSNWLRLLWVFLFLLGLFFILYSLYTAFGTAKIFLDLGSAAMDQVDATLTQKIRALPVLAFILVLRAIIETYINPAVSEALNYVYTFFVIGIILIGASPIVLLFDRKNSN